MYLSIDFEDYYHDLKRGLGLSESGQTKSKQLWDKYENINNFLNKTFLLPSISFFSLSFVVDDTEIKNFFDKKFLRFVTLPQKPDE